LTVDTIAPIVTVVSPPDHSVTKDGTITVTGTVTDSSPVTMTVNGVTASITGAGMTRNFSAAGVSLKEGPNPIVAAARDVAGHASQTSITVDRDTIPPTIAILDG